MRKAFLALAVVSVCAALILAGCKPTTTDAPKIALFDITSGKVAVNPGDTVDFGTQGSAGATRNFSIENTGDADLTLTGAGDKVVVSGDTANFNIPSQPPASVPAGGTASFDIVYSNTNGTGLRNATLAIESDDPDLASLSFSVTANDTYVS